MSEQRTAPGDQEATEEEGIKPLVTRREFIIGAGAGAVVAAGAAGAATMIRSAGPNQGAPVGAPGATGQVPSTATQATGVLPPSMRRVSLNINGAVHEVAVDTRESLWETITYQLGLGGVNLGCDRLQCGACAVVVDGKAVNGCGVYSARLGRGQKITTVEGIRQGPGIEGLHALQRAYWEQGGFQCGICTRGFIMSAYSLLQTNTNPTRPQIREALAGNICRCSEYPKMYLAVEMAAAELRGAPAMKPVMGPGREGGGVDTSGSAV